jgi:formylglycine-generating enzyme required for sulfatase activity
MREISEAFAYGVKEDFKSAEKERPIKRRAKKTKSVSETLSSMYYEMAHELESAVDTENIRIVVFIDDLDRCLPDRAVEFLKIIKLFLDVEGYLFILGIDRDVVEKDSFEIFPEDYLAKMIQLPLELPAVEPGRKRRFIESLLCDADGFKEHSDIIEVGAGDDPRMLKRFVNLLSFTVRLAETLKDDILNDKVEIKESEAHKKLLQEYFIPLLYIKWAIIVFRYPEIHNDIKSNKKRLIELQKVARGEAGDAGDEIDERLKVVLARGEGFPDDDWLIDRFIHLTDSTVAVASEEEKEEESESEEVEATEEIEEKVEEAVEVAEEEKQQEQEEEIEEPQGEEVEATGEKEEEEVVVETVAEEVIEKVEAEVVEEQQEEATADAQEHGQPHKPGDMVIIPKGKFLYGEAKEEKDIDYDYYIDVFPVTNKQYKEFVDATDRDVPYREESWARPYSWNQDSRTYREGMDNHPVVLVSYNDAVDFCKWRSEKEGEAFRIPTEEEWEKAARGSDGREYPWGNDFGYAMLNCADYHVGKVLKDYEEWAEEFENGYYKDNKNKALTTECGKFAGGVSPYGCFDMAGNAWEWTDSIYEDKETEKVLRGGSWNFESYYCRCTDRDGGGSDNVTINVGFRCVK